MLFVLLYLIVHIFQCYASLAEHLFRLGPVMVFPLANHAFNAAVDDEHRAGAAGRHPAIQGCFIERDPQARRLADGILFGMHCAHAVLGDSFILMQHLFHEMADLVAMRQATRRSNIPGNQDLPVASNDTTAAAAVAGGPLRNGVGYLHKVLIPRGADVFFLVHFPVVNIIRKGTNHFNVMISGNYLPQALYYLYLPDNPDGEFCIFIS